MDTPLVSVILATYNGSRYIREAISSVLAQKYDNFELIIIDDASTDSTAHIIAEYVEKDSRVRSIKNDKNLKLVESLNRGISFSKWEYIARIDDDDRWSDTGKLMKQIQEFEKNPNLAVVGTQGYVIDENGTQTGQEMVHALHSIDVRREFRVKNALIHTSILAKKRAFVGAWLYKKDWLYVEDFDLWLRVLGKGYDVANISDFSIEYRMRSGSTTGKKYHHMQWLTFCRLFIEKFSYGNHDIKYYFLFIRLVLVIVPERIIRYLK